MNIISASDSSFIEEVINSPIPVLVDFWAPWCAPCRMIAPILEEIAAEFNGKIKIVKLNVDENSKAMEYGIRSIPTLLIFKDGKVVDQIIGVVAKGMITAKLDYYAQGVGLLN